MARPARHKIELSEKERVMLERRARAEKLPFQDVQRARIVLYAAQGMADTEIAARLDTSPGGWWDGGEDGSPSSVLRGSRTDRGQVDRGVFPPTQVAAVQAVACELPIRYG